MATKENRYSVFVESKIVDGLGEELLDGVPVIYECPLFSATIDRVCEFLRENPHLLIDADKMLIVEVKHFEAELSTSFSTYGNKEDDTVVKLSIFNEEE